MYIDSAYIVKYYIHEPKSAAVREILRKAESPASSALAIAEVACAFHRRLREGNLTGDLFQEVLGSFLKHVEAGAWSMAPVNDRVLRRVSRMLRLAPASLYLRSGDAVHLATALEIGELEVWTSDRHMLAAAPHFGLIGRTA
jgi:predicted nucleic acid-binding protein